MAKEGSWDTISKFVSDMRNASRLAAYVDSVVDVYESKEWRKYSDATGLEYEWRASEFDYFLISCGAEYQDVQRLLTWDRAKSVELARAMESDKPAARRPVSTIDKTWRSPSGKTLTDLATQQGWARPTGEFRAAPVPKRALAVARHGATNEELAKRNREQTIPANRKKELSALVDELVANCEDSTEARFALDSLQAQVRASAKR